MIVVDASALLALLKNEPGADAVIEHMVDPVMSTVNLAETLTRLAEDGGDAETIKAELDEGLIEFVPVSDGHALAAAQLRVPTKRWGLSLGDRICLALGRELRLPVLTADRRWKEFDVGVEIVLIR
ncbi:MAG: type II toxin-antitoxin system VapC family toxin [Micropepsaceae bacterium]